MHHIKRWVAILTLFLAAMATLPTGLAAQEPAWRLTAGGSQVWFSGGLRDTTASDVAFSLNPTIAWALAADHAIGRLRLGIGLSYLSTALRVVSPELTIIDETFDLRQFEIAALVTLPPWRVGSSGAGIRLSVGPALDIWSVTNEDSRTRFGGLAALLFTAPITPGWTLLASAAGSASGSPFKASELPADFESSTLWTGRIGFGVQYAF